MDKIDYAALRELLGDRQHNDHCPFWRMSGTNEDCTCGLGTLVASFDALLTAAQERDALAVEVERLRAIVNAPQSDRQRGGHVAVRFADMVGQARRSLWHLYSIDLDRSDVAETLKHTGVPSLLEEADELRMSVERLAEHYSDMQARAESAEAKHAALVARVEGAVAGKVVGVAFEKWDRPAWCVMDDRDAVPLDMGGQRVRILADTERQGEGDA